MDSGILFIMIETTTIRRCIKGDRKAQKQVYVTCAPYVYTIVKSYIYNHADIKDVMQEVFAAIFFKMDKFNPQKGNFKSWISSIATYKAIDFLKAKNKIQFEYELEIFARHPISQNWTFNTGISHAFYSGHVKNSPLVATNQTTQVMLGVHYVF